MRSCSVASSQSQTMRSRLLASSWSPARLEISASRQSGQRWLLCSRSLASASRASCQASSPRSSMASSQARLSSSPGDRASASRRSTVSSASSAGRDPMHRATPRSVGGRALATGEPAVVERLLGRRRPVVGAAARVRNAVAECRPDVGQPRVILRFLEPAARFEEERLELVRRALGDEECGRRRPSRGREPRRSRRRPRRPARPRPRRSGRLAPGRPSSAWARSSSAWTSGRSGRVSVSARSSSPAAARSSPLSSARCPAASSRSPARSASAWSGRPSSASVAGGLLEVVADDLVQLDEGPLAPRARRRTARAGRRGPPSEERRTPRRG